MRAPNLKKLFPKYKFDWDPARKRGSDQWMMLILCRCGTICPFGKGELLWEGENHPGIAKRVEKVGRRHCDGDNYDSIIFKVEDFPQVAKIVGARRR